jgi:hypothetical protein
MRSAAEEGGVGRLDHERRKADVPADQGGDALAADLRLA